MKMFSCSKYGNKKVEVDGITFDSRKEANYYCDLKLLKRAGVVKDFQRQVRFELQPGFESNGERIRPIYYIADFVVTYTDGVKEVVDVKGYETDVYKLKKKMLLYRYQDIVFKEVKKK